jgi:uncharacterized membrane protein YhhN
MTVGWPTGDKMGQGLLLLSLALGFAYWLNGFGLSAPYPFSVALKASGIVLLAGYALWRGRGFLAAGLLAGAAGDAFLALEPSQLFFGMAAFATGHLIYVVIFARRLQAHGFRGRIGAIIAGLSVIFGVAAMIYLAPQAGDLRLPVIVYNLVILLMAVTAALSRTPVIALIGALLFVASDAVLGVQLFAGGEDWLGRIVWAAYYSGQFCIALGLAQPDRD